MAAIETEAAQKQMEMRQAAAFLKSDLACAFGPGFFLGHLGRFVRDHCPDPSEHLPSVRVHLIDGAILDICHIVGVAPRWVMLAVREAGTHHDGMALELVPYDIIQRIHIGSRHAEGPSIGFAQKQAPTIVSPETLLRDAMAPADAGR